MVNDLHYLSIGELAGLIASRKLSPVELVESLIHRVEQIDLQTSAGASSQPHRQPLECQEDHGGSEKSEHLADEQTANDRDSERCAQFAPHPTAESEG